MQKFVKRFFTPFQVVLFLMFFSVMMVSCQFFDRDQEKQAEKDALAEEEIYKTPVDQPAVFPGGDEARGAFLAANIRYPEIARLAGIEGTVIVSFVIRKDGTVSQTEVLRTINLDNLSMESFIDLLLIWDTFDLGPQPKELDSLKVVIQDLFNKETLRVINRMPVWEPAVHEGQKVNVQYALPIRYTLGL